MRQYRVRRCKPCYRANQRRWNDSKRTPEVEARWAQARREKDRRIKEAVFAAYGGFRCACCGETERIFLTLDHMLNNGAEWRRQVFGARNYAGRRTYWWLLKHNFPAGFQVLCMNCNFGKRMNHGKCPHLGTRNDYPLVGVGSSDPKRIALVKSEEIVSPALKDAAARR